MWNYGQGQALGRGRGRGRGIPPLQPFGRGFPPPPPYAPPVALPAGAQMLGHHANRDGERVNGSRVPQFRDLPEAAGLDARTHWVDHVMTELAAVGSGIRICFQHRKQLLSVDHDANFDIAPRVHHHFANVDTVVQFSVFGELKKGETLKTVVNDVMGSEKKSSAGAAK